MVFFPVAIFTKGINQIEVRPLTLYTFTCCVFIVALLSNIEIMNDFLHQNLL